MVDWTNNPQIETDPDVVHGAPVFRGTRLPVDAALESYYAYREIEGLSDQEAVNATLESFPSIPNGAEGLRAVLAYESSHEHQLTP